MQKNCDAISQKDFDLSSLKKQHGMPPWNVSEVLTILQRRFSEKHLRKCTISDRGLRKRLEGYRRRKILGKKEKGKEVYYYFNKTSANAVFFWERKIRPFIDGMRIEKGSLAWGFTPIWETPTHLYVLGHNAAILEGDLDITSKLQWEDHPRDVIGDTLYSLREVITREIHLRLDIGLKKAHTEDQEVICNLKKYFENRKLAFVYVLDGSEFVVWEKGKMGTCSP